MNKAEEKARLEALERLERRIEMLEPDSIVILGGVLPAQEETMMLLDKYGVGYITDKYAEVCEKLNRFYAELSEYFEGLEGK